MSANDLLFFLLKEEKYLLKLNHFLIATMKGKLCMNQYILNKDKRTYEWYEHDLMSYIDNLKYEHFVEDMDNHFSRMKIINFDLIHHEC